MNINSRFRSVSDDDVCSNCANCHSPTPHGDSQCFEDWPGHTDSNGYVIRCSELVPYRQYLPKEI